MKDETKRKLIRFLNAFDRLHAKRSRNKGWNPSTLMYDEYDEAGELDRMSGKELSRELLRQILYTLPVALFLLFLLAAVVWFLIVMP